jgi:hypothetical protein
MKKTVGYYHIVLNLIKMSISEEVTLASTGLTYATDPDYTNPFITEPQLQALAATVQHDLGTRINAPNPQLTATEQQDVNALSRAIMTVRGEVELVANRVAQGDRAVFETIVRRIGFHPSKVRTKHVRIVAFLPSEKGNFHFIVPAESKDVIYIYQFGATTAEGTAPAQWQTVPLDRTELIMGGFASGAIIGLRYAVQKTPSHLKPKTSLTTDASKIVATKTTAPSGVLTVLSVNKTGKVTMMQGVNYWHFSDIMYFRIP